MSKFLGVLSVLVVMLMAMGFAVANAGYRVTIDLGLFTLYQVPVTLVAFSGLFVGMVAMFITGVHTDLKVRRILRDRFAQESRQERTAIDRNQKDLFGGDPEPGEEPGAGEKSASEASGPESLASLEDAVEDPGGVSDDGGDTEKPFAEVEEPSEQQQID